MRARRFAETQVFLPAAEHAGLHVAPKKVVIWEKWVPTFSQMGKVGSYIFSNGKGGFTIDMKYEMEITMIMQT